jgi:RNA polymerase sigma factor (sigma-70 family)
MVTPPTLPLARFIHHLATVALPDAQLLKRFSDVHDGEAFAILVRRHGPMVMAVCRRVLHDSHAAEDAFQATFLVLACKAGSLRVPQAVGPWLHGVAHRTALKARAGAARRRLCENHACLLRPEAQHPVDPTWCDLLPVLDEAIARLPCRYRAPFVLCCLEGRTVSQAADDLGWPRGTVATRLAQARKRLRKMLTHHGVTLSAALFSGALDGSNATAAMPAAVVRSLAQCALDFMDDSATATGSVSAGVVALAREVLQGMMFTRIRMTVLSLMAVALLGWGISAAALWPKAAAQTAQPPTTSPKSEPGKMSTTSDKAKELPLPLAPMPAQALVRLDSDSKLIVHMVGMHSKPVKFFAGRRQPVTTYDVTPEMMEFCFDAKEVRAFNTQGELVGSTTLRKLLAEETLVLVTMKFDPLYLRVLKEGTLVLVVPVLPALEAPTGPVVVPPLMPAGPPAEAVPQPQPPIKVK